MTKRILAEVLRARELFPGNQYMLAALSEEAGEVARALLDHARGHKTALEVFVECVQVAAMAIRVAVEGDSAFPYEIPRAENARIVPL